MHRMMIIWVIAVFITLSHSAQGQKDSLQDVKPIEERFEKNLNELVEQWYVKRYLSPQKDSLAFDSLSSGPEYPDSVYLKRISNMSSAIPLSYNKIVRNFIHVYSGDKRERVEVMLGLANYYFPVFERIFDQYNLPLELKYLAIIESALNPRAVSRAGATGLWQFMYSTGRVYGLTINSFVDQRRNPVKATDAAARYLKDLYEIFGEWDLAIAAYNCGPRNVSKAIYRAGGKRNFWDIYYHLPYETRGYFPAFVAAMYVMNHHENHNLSPRSIDMPYATDTVHINQDLHLKQLSEVLNLPLKQIQDLNPQYRKDIVPASQQTYAIELPLNKIEPFINRKDSIFAYKDSVFFRQQIVREPGRSRFVPQTPSGKEKLHYKVKPGDNLGYIAEWYNVRASELRHWNNIRGNTIRTGQRLVVYVPENKVGYYKEVNSLSFEAKQKRSGQPVSPKKSDPNQQAEKDENYIYYKVRHGDTLWDIARKYPGVSQKEIIRLNDLPNAQQIQVGQQLKIKKKT